jgi:hypothetical protein
VSTASALHRDDTDRDDAGVEGNSRLTAVNGTLLLVLFAIEGVSILSIDRLISLHIFLGVLLVGPVLLKTATTGYRFVRYYTGARTYRRKGPPHPVLRIIGPLVIVASLAVLGTGIGLIATGPAHRGPMLTLHQGSFIVWLVVMSLHVLGHLVEAGRSTWRELSDPRTAAASRRRPIRMAVVLLCLLAGTGLAAAVMPAAHQWTSHTARDFGQFDDR